jgi:hypothetical protein
LLLLALQELPLHIFFFFEMTNPEGSPVFFSRRMVW